MRAKKVSFIKDKKIVKKVKEEPIVEVVAEVVIEPVVEIPKKKEEHTPSFL